MADTYLKCPKCGNKSTAEFWDRATRAEVGIGPDAPYVGVLDAADKHEEYQTYYHCPICNEEIDGTELAKK